MSSEVTSAKTEEDVRRSTGDAAEIPPPSSATSDTVAASETTSVVGRQTVVTPGAGAGAALIRQRLSPRNDNIQHKDQRKVHFQAEDGDLNKFKASRKRRGQDDRANLENDSTRGDRVKQSRPQARKRSYSFSEGGHAKYLPPTLPGGGHKNSGPSLKRWKSGRVGSGKGRGGGGNVLPSKFLLGGNIHDPLNLNSLSDEKLRMVSCKTPESSPLPTPKHRKSEYKIEVLIPPNISDPLNLNAGGNDGDYASKLVSPLTKKKKVRHRNRTKKRFPALDISKLPGPKPQDGGVGKEGGIEGEREGKEPGEGVDKEKKEEGDKEKGPASDGEGEGEKPKPKGNRFIHGNYNRYYGYRNPGNQEDPRIKHLKPEWFTDKRVLDIGCNIGHVTISVGKMFSPQRIVGVDIDSELIRVARKNIRHYMDTRPGKKTKYPRSFSRQFGSLNPLSLNSEGEKIKEFPHNVEFYATDYVPENEQLLEIVQPEFDTILCLSTTKWMHLNNGDAGLKRAFKKMYSQLKQGGVLILEAQSFSNYGKRKNLSEKILQNYKEIKFRPEQFSDFLLREVSFTRCEVVALPSHSSKGFQRPLQVFIKGIESEVSASTTPCSYGISPHAYNPAFTPFYGKFTPGSAYTPSQSQREPGTEVDKPTEPGNSEFVYPGPSHLYSGPTPGGYSANSTPSGFTPGTTPHGGRYSANSTPSHLTSQYSRGSNKLPVYTGPTGLSFPSPGNLASSPVYGVLPGAASPQAEDGVGEPRRSASCTATPHNTPAPLPPSPSPPSISSEEQTPSYTPQYTPSYTPAHSAHSQGNTPVYSGPQVSPSGGPSSPLYSPGNATPLVSYSPSQYSPEAVGPGYSPSASGANYSPDPSGQPGGGPSYSPDPGVMAAVPGPSYSPDPGVLPQGGGGGPSYSPDPGPGGHGGGGGGGGPSYSPDPGPGGRAGGLTPAGGASYSPDTVRQVGGSSYSPDTVSGGAAYSPAEPNYSAGGGTNYSPDTVGPGYSPSGPAYSPSGSYSPAYSPSSGPGLMSSPHNYSPSFHSPNSPANIAYSPHYSPGNATPLCTRSPFPSPSTAPLSTRSPMPSPSIQTPEVTGNTTPHPGPEESPLSSSPRLHRYSWSGANLSGRNTPVDPQNPEDRGIMSNPPSVDANPPSVDTNPPSVDANPPSVDANPPSVDANPPSVDANPPSVDVNPPSVDANPPSVDANPPSVDANPKSIDANPPSIDANPPSFDDQIASNPSSVEGKVTSSPPSVDDKNLSNPPSVEDQLIVSNPPSVDDRIASNPPSVDDRIASNPPSVDDRIASNPPSVDDKIASNPPSVDDRIASNPPSVDDKIASNPPSVDDRIASNPPSVDDKIASDPPSVDEILSSNPASVDDQTASNPASVDDRIASNSPSTEERLGASGLPSVDKRVASELSSVEPRNESDLPALDDKETSNPGSVDDRLSSNPPSIEENKTSNPADNQEPSQDPQSFVPAKSLPESQAVGSQEKNEQSSPNDNQDKQKNNDVLQRGDGSGAPDVEEGDGDQLNEDDADVDGSVLRITEEKSLEEEESLSHEAEIAKAGSNLPTTSEEPAIETSGDNGDSNQSLLEEDGGALLIVNVSNTEEAAEKADTEKLM